MAINSFSGVERKLKKLYFYEDLVSGEFYRLHVDRCKRYFEPTGDTRKRKNRRPYLLWLASCIPDKDLNDGVKFLPLRCKKGGRIHCDFIEVPIKIEKYSDILFILDQLRPLTTQESGTNKEEALAYILGMLLSDTSKPKGYRFSKQFLLSLTRRYEWSLIIGENVCRYFDALGIRAHRIKDHEKVREREPFGTYRWISEKSPFIQYLMQTFLGLAQDQLTTYDRVQMKWIFSSPKNFIISFLQGLCDGDGTAHNFWRIEISCDPNQEFIINLLRYLGIKSYLDDDAVSISHRESIVTAARLPIFKFAEGRNRKLEKLVQMIAHYKSMENIDNTIKNEIMFLRQKNMSDGQISEHIFDHHNIGLQPTAINHFVRKFNSNKP